MAAGSVDAVLVWPGKVRSPSEVDSVLNGAISKLLPKIESSFENSFSLQVIAVEEGFEEAVFSDEEEVVESEGAADR